jgi:plastocyanin
MKAALIIATLLVAVLIMGCQTEEQQDLSTGNVVMSGERAITTVEQETVEPTVKDYDMRLTEDGFFPSTLTANKGDTVQLHFLLQEPQFVSIEELGIAEEVEKSTLEFVVPQAGEYDLICMTCEDNHAALLIVH